MKLFNKLLAVLPLLVDSAYSRVATFKVISFGEKTQLKILDGSEYDLTPVENDEILYGITVDDAPDGDFLYYYIVDGEKENFTRNFTADMSTTHNDFFSRKDTVKELKSFEHPCDLPTWDRSIGKTKLFDETYIPTIHIMDISGNNTEHLFNSPYDFENVQLEQVKIYLKDSVEIFEDVTGKPKNRGFSKFQLKLKLGKNKNK